MSHPDPAAVLAAYGCAPGPAGWSLAELLDLALDAGLRVVVEPEERRGPAHRFRALVFCPPDPLVGNRYGTRTARRHGATEAGALAAALAAALGRPGAQPAA